MTSLKTAELRFYHLCQPRESFTQHVADEVFFDKDVYVLGFDGAVSSFRNLHVETWLWVDGEDIVKPFGHVICNWECWWLYWRRMGNNAGVIPAPGLLVKKGTSLKLGVWWDNMNDVARDFHCKTSVYFK